MALSPAVLKGLSTLAGIGTITGGGFLINSLINKKTEKSSVSNKLKEDKFTILNLDTSVQESQDSKWQTIFTSYSSLSSDKVNLKIGDLTLNSDGDKNNGIKQLKEACSNLLSTRKESSDFNKNYKLAAQWCVEPISVEDLLKRKGINYLDTTGSGSSGEWERVTKKYERIQTETYKPLNEVTWTRVEGNNYSTNIAAIKGACNTRKTKSSHQEGFLNSFQEAQSWCTIEASK